ncbi:transposase [Pseudaminobacter sp. NGMCC 1.201702]|uniref:transposase n=1 Tax=Pseudaminobacter sp. NGMCC 1.201702 TaxID=3391825 RepID=UPI0039EEA599
MTSDPRRSTCNGGNTFNEETGSTTENSQVPAKAVSSEGSRPSTCCNRRSCCKPPHAGISEQTYYQWKKSAAPASTNGDLKDLLALEEENVRLKKLLAERLREENAELKKRLGLD